MSQAQQVLRLVPAGASVSTVVEALQAASTEARADWNREQQLRAKAALVFAYWAKVLRHDRALLDDKRETRLLVRLRENDGDVSELLYVVDAARRDRFFREHPSACKVSVLFRDREQVEHLAESQQPYRDGVAHPLAVKYGLDS